MANSIFSVIVDEGQFYARDEYDPSDAPVYGGDPVLLKKFKKDIKKYIPNIVILNHGGGEIEFMFNEKDFAEFQKTADAYMINLSVADIVEM